MGPKGDRSVGLDLENLLFLHNCSRRISVSKPAALTVLNRIGWPDGPGWKSLRPRRHSLGLGLSFRGGCWTLGTPVWASGRKPGKDHPLYKLNRKHGLALYGLAVEETPDSYTLDLSGVRSTDVDHLMINVLGLDASDWSVEYFRRAETYCVLASHEAHRLANALGGRERKDGTFLHLLEDHPIRMTIRTRTRATACLHIYRVAVGSTAAYRCELSLAGRTESRGQFTSTDVDHLRDALAGIIQAHDLHPVQKPDVWEPRDLTHHVSCDPLLARLPQSTIKGMAPDSLPELPNCNTLKPLFLMDPSNGTRVSCDQPSIMEGSDDSSSCLKERNPALASGSLVPDPHQHPDCQGSLYQDPRPSPLPMDQDQTQAVQATGPDSQRSAPAGAGAGAVSSDSGPVHQLAREVIGHPGLLSEVILGADDDPVLVVSALAGASALAGKTLSVELLTDGSTWESLVELGIPADPCADVRVIVVDVGAMASCAPAVSVFDPITGSFARGPLAHWAVDAQHAQVRVLASRLAPLLQSLQAAASLTGQSVVFVSVDVRPDHGRTYRDRPNQADLNSDQRVRSILGDAGRFYCSQRYHLERHEYEIAGGASLVAYGVTCWRDGIHGRVGRYVLPAGQQDPLLTVFKTEAQDA